MKKMIVFLACIALVCVYSISAFSQGNRGAEKFKIDAGKKEAVPFPHHVHQDALEKKCSICHDTFPKKPGSIKQMKADGKLKKKEVMNKLCIKCHKAKKKAGEKAGPTSCSKCHKK